MQQNQFIQSLRIKTQETKTHLCIGLDPDLEKIPDFFKSPYKNPSEIVRDFLEVVISETSQFCISYKPNLAFFEALGENGWKTFNQCLDMIPDNKLVIADAKRGDIGNTAAKYAEAFLGDARIDALTVNPLMGFDTLEPMLKYSGKAIYVLSLTSNEGASDFFSKPFDGFSSMAEYIAAKLNSLQDISETHLGMVVGATKLSEATKLLTQFPNSSLLMPGVGAQGAKAQDLKNLLDTNPSPPLIPISRGITYPKADSLLEFKKEVRANALNYSLALASNNLQHA